MAIHPVILGMNISLKVIDKAVENICNILVGSVLDVSGKKSIYPNVNKTEENTFKKLWFTYDIKIAQLNLRGAKRLYKKFGGDHKKKVFMKKNGYRRKN